MHDMKIKLDAALRDELSLILRDNEDKMTDLQKVFWKCQFQSLKLGDKRGIKWHPMMVRLALHLHSLSAGAYRFWNDVKVLYLPSERRLYDCSHFIDAKEGCQKEITEMVINKIEKCGSEDHYKFVNLMFDEMHVRSGLLVKRSTGELVGYTKLDGIDEELRKIQHELDTKMYKPRLAKKVLVYMVRGITSHNVKDVIAIHSTDDLSVTQLYDQTWDVTNHLEEFEIKVLSVTCDGASVNRKFIQMNCSLNKNSSFVYSTKNLAAGDSRPLFFILDPPHLLKTIRNALANSFAHRKTRQLWKNNESLSWKTIEDLYHLTKRKKFPGHKLTLAHIKLSSFSCMTVLYATQTLSKSVAESIEEHSSDPVMEKHNTVELVRFILLMNRFFECLNGMEDKHDKDANAENEEVNSNPDKEPYKSLSDPRLVFLKNDVLDYFKNWKQQVQERPGIFSQTERSQMIKAIWLLEPLKSQLMGLLGLFPTCSPLLRHQQFVPEFLTRIHSSSILVVRRAQGDSRNPGTDRVLGTRLSLMHQIDTPSRKGNTEAEKRKEIEVDSTPLPSRKKPKKPDQD